MADEKEQVQAEQEPVKEEAKEEKSIDEISAEIEAKLSEKFKAEIAGLNRKVSEKEKELKAKDLEAMSAEEKTAALAKQAEEAEARIKAAEKKLAVDSALYEAGLPVDVFGSRITGETEDEIREDVVKIKEYIDNLVTKSSEEKIQEALKGRAPSRQDEPKGKQTLEEIAQIPDRQKRLEAYKANGYS